MRGWFGGSVGECERGKGASRRRMCPELKIRTCGKENRSPPTRPALPFQATRGVGLSPGTEPRAPWRRKFPDRPLLPACFPDTPPRTRCPARAPPPPAAPGPELCHRGGGAKGHQQRSRAFAPAGSEEDLHRAVKKPDRDWRSCARAPSRNTQGRAR